MAEFMFLGLRMTEGVSVREFEEYFGENMESIYGEVLKKHPASGSAGTRKMAGSF